MNKLMTVLVVSLGLALTSPVAIANTHYVYAGSSNFDMDGFEDTETGFSATVGTRFSDYFGVEVTYYRLDFDVYDIDLIVNGLSVAPVAYWDMSDSFSLYGKAGLGYAKAEAEYYGEKADDSETKVIYGAGLQFIADNGFSARLSYDVFDALDADVISFSVGYSF